MKSSLIASCAKKRSFLTQIPPVSPLKQIVRVLNDAFPQNDGGACGKLDEFLVTVDEKEAAGKLRRALAT